LEVFQALGTITKAALDVEYEAVSDMGKLPTGADLVLVLGSEPKPLLEAAKVIPKGRTTHTLRGRVHKFNNMAFMFSYSPGIRVFDYGKFIDLLTDVHMAVRYVRTGKYDPDMGQYRYVQDFSEMCVKIDALYNLTGHPVEVAFDTETIGLDPYAVATLETPGARFVCLQASCEVGKTDVVYFGSRKREEEFFTNDLHFSGLKYLLTSPKISLRAANGKYDFGWMHVISKRYGKPLYCTNFKFDTTLVGSLLDENRSNSLDVHAKLYTDLGGYADEFNKTTDKSRMDLVPQSKMLPYSGGDTDACLQVSMAQRDELLQDDKLTKFYVNILHPAARAFEIVEQGGVFIDKKAFDALEAELTKSMKELSLEASKIIGGRVIAKHIDLSFPGGFNMTHPGLLTDFMFSPMGLNLKPKMFTEKPDKLGQRKPSTALEHIQKFADVEEAKVFVGLMKTYSTAHKAYSTYVKGFRKFIRSDGRFHPSYFFFKGDRAEKEGGANTGRLSAKDPAFQTIPNHHPWAKAIRRCYTAPPGYLVGQEDYSQGELKVIACVANEPTMIASYKAGMDLHVMTSAKFAGYEYEDLMALEKTNPELFKETRQLGKAGNFGLIYGIATPGFIVYAEHDYHVKLSYDEAETFRSGFFAMYPLLVTYHNEYKSFVRKYKFVRSPLGRVRHLPLIESPSREVRSYVERQAINSPIQGTLSDMLLWSVSIEHKMGLFEIAPVFGSTHDSAVFYVPEDNWQSIAKQKKEIMENLPFEKVGWEPQLKFSADVEIGPSMGELKKIKW
jgi:DNA polymerase I-like protein with 3'-5' exonuclease and polymerase domains